MIHYQELIAVIMYLTSIPGLGEYFKIFTHVGECLHMFSDY